VNADGTSPILVARGASDGVAAGGTWVASVLGWGAIERMQTGAAGFVVTVA